MFSSMVGPLAVFALWQISATAAAADDDLFAGDGKLCMKNALTTTKTCSFEACQLYSDAQDYHQVLAERDSCFAERDSLHTALHSATKHEFLVVVTYEERIKLVRLDETATYESLVSGIHEKFVETTDKAFVLTAESTEIEELKVSVTDDASFKDALLLADSEGHKLKLNLVLGEVLAALGSWTLYKVPTEGKMTATNIKQTCEALGFATPCWGDGNVSYVSDACTQIPRVSHQYIMRDLSLTLCEENNSSDPHKCEPMYGTYVFMDDWQNDSGCGAEDGNYCATGKNYSDRYSLCAN